MARNCSSQVLKITKGKDMRTLYSIILMRFLRPLGPTSQIQFSPQCNLSKCHSKINLIR